MTPIHRVRLAHSTEGAGGYHGWLDQWLINMEPWADNEVTNESPTLREHEFGGGEWYQTELAFEWTEDKTHILDNLHLYAQSYCEWHRIGYHVCSHDEDEPEPCSWDEQRESGTVPEYIPDMEP